MSGVVYTNRRPGIEVLHMLILAKHPDWSALRCAAAAKLLYEDRRRGDGPDAWGDYYIVRNSGRCVFVKAGAFFRDQGGQTLDWGKHWTKITAASIEHARRIGEAVLP